MYETELKAEYDRNAALIRQAKKDRNFLGGSTLAFYSVTTLPNVILGIDMTPDKGVGSFVVPFVGGLAISRIFSHQREIHERTMLAQNTALEELRLASNEGTEPAAWAVETVESLEANIVDVFNKPNMGEQF